MIANSKPVLQKQLRILVIRRDNIGDLVCTTPALAALRCHYPTAEIGVLVNSYNFEVLSGNPNIDHVYVYQKLKHVIGFRNQISALAQRLKLIIKLRAWKPDVVILAKSSYDRHGLNIARQIDAKKIIGFVPDDQKSVKHLPDVPLVTPQFNDVHEVEAINQLLAPLRTNDALGKLKVYPSVLEVDRFRKTVGATNKRIALHISAREVERRWGAENFIGLAKHIVKNYEDAQILIFWSPGKKDDPCHPGDDDTASQIMGVLGNQGAKPVITRNITELIAALSICDLFVGADGGALHLAVALDKPVLALFENKPDKLNHWYPWKTKSIIVHSMVDGQPDVQFITQDQVQSALSQLL